MIHGRTIFWGAICAAVFFQITPGLAQTMEPRIPGHDAYPDPYVMVSDFLKLPPGRKMGATGAVAVDSQGNIWVADRCGANNCEGSKLNPIMEFGPNGNFIKSFGAGKFVLPHDIFVDGDDHIWVADNELGKGIGDDVIEFDRSGKVLRVLGKPGVVGDGKYSFTQPNAVIVSPQGDIFVADGYAHNLGYPRIIHYDKHGKFVKLWGVAGAGAGEFDIPNALAMDREGRLYVADLNNNRIQIFTQAGMLLDVWSQFGRPSAIYIDKNDILYSSDSQSRNPVEFGYHPGWARGIRIGSVKDGIVRQFIPYIDPEADLHRSSGGEGIWVREGVIYRAEVPQRAVVKYVLKQ